MPEVCDWCPALATKRVEDARGYETSVCCDDCMKFAILYVFPIDSPECGERHA